MTFLRFAMLAIAAQLSGCAEFFYDQGQDAALRRCDSISHPIERNDCRRQATKAYDDYTRNRKNSK